jgi:uncharacterized protein YjbI with pentapeptide repeats
VAGILVLGIGQVAAHGLSLTDLFNSLYIHIGSDLMVASVLILSVDRLAARREALRLKDQLIRELSSADHALAARALGELHGRRWLYDGTLDGAILAGSNLAGASLERARLRAANLAGANVEGANFSRADLVGCNFSGARMARVNLEMADLTGSVLEDACLDGADMARSRLTASRLAGASLADADMTSVDLSGADLRGASLTSARLGGVVHDAGTHWPDGVSVPAAPPAAAPPGLP